jgi:DNA-binding transcriptional ArsR family regulator
MTPPLTADREAIRRSATHDDPPVILGSEPELLDLQEYLLFADRLHPVVAFALCREENDDVALWHEQVRRIVGSDARIYFIFDEFLLACLRDGLGRRLALTPGSARVWWPELSKRSDPGDHPLVLQLDGESPAETLAELARQFDLSRPHVRRELKLIEDARALAEHRLSEIVEQDQKTAERLRDAHRERHREATRAQEAETRLQATLARLVECEGRR